MAARKKKSAPGAQKPTATKTEPEKNKIAKKKKEPRVGTRRSTRFVKTPVVFSEDGRVSLEKTPAHLVEIAKTNATSRLLSLPDEIRAMIFEYALSNDQPVRVNQRYFSILPDRCNMYNFRLPQVCRQIYSETAILFYLINSFKVSSNSLTRTVWTRRLLLAQRKAITSIELEELVLYELMVNPYCRPLKAIFPDLKTIKVRPQPPWLHARVMGPYAWAIGTTGLSNVLFTENDGRTLGQLRDMGKDWAVEKTKEREGNDIVIIFEYDFS